MRNYYKLLLLTCITGCVISGCKVSPENGVAIQLAKDRKELISNVEYTLHFSIPESKSMKIGGKVDISFCSKEKRVVVIDFREEESNVLSVNIDGRSVSYRFESGHIIIPKRLIKQGKNVISVGFIAGETSLNRKDDFLYTLFVPDRASTAFPCFDQPDLKAVFKLFLKIPERWVAISNGVLVNSENRDSTRICSFEATKPISTYLFAFVAGQFESISRTENNRTITMYHRESDSTKVKRNLDQVFSAHFYSLNWLKDYTGFAYPFGKLDFILIPDFQYGGMEHPGAIYYRDSRILLEENPSITKRLQQANLIAHEVSHQWFGDLVTMRWFNDVWLKEVFAGFMADKIVGPQFPEVNHNLNFLLSHYPQSYSVDRTAGANPIRQDLENLLFAGTLYGDIIYNKAPIMLMQLELIMGEEPFRTGIREYLQTYQMANADWIELVFILDRIVPQDLSEWSRAWVELPGMPIVKSDIKFNEGKGNVRYSLNQYKTKSGSNCMGMKFKLLQDCQDNKLELPVDMINDSVSIEVSADKMGVCPILPNSDGKGYGTFYPDFISLVKFFDSSYVFNDDLNRASWFVMLNELFLNGKIGPDKYFGYLLSSLQSEKEPFVRQYLLNLVELVWWRFFNENQRTEIAEKTEHKFYSLLKSKEIDEIEKKTIFMSFVDIALSEEALELIYRVWNQELQIQGVKLDEPDYMVLACELAVRNYPNADSIIINQESRIKNKDRLAKFRFVKRAISPEEVQRDSFFVSLSEPANRRPEPWVTESLRYLHHPLRTNFSIRYLKQSLDMLPELQRTGDIFFPKGWLDATLWGYSSKEAEIIINCWLKENLDVPKNLRDKVLQSADMVFRTSAMKNNN